METKKELTCICCPLGCQITVTINENEVKEVTGNTCPRGEAYARKELTNPTRIVTSTVRVDHGTIPMVSVKTASDIPKESMLDCIRVLKGITMEAPVQIGDVVVKDIAGTGVDVIATKQVDKSI